MEIRILTDEINITKKEIFKIEFQMASQIKVMSEEKKRELEKKLIELKKKSAKLMDEQNIEKQNDGQLSIGFEDE